MSDVERPWGLGDDGLDALWTRLTQALNGGDPERLNQIVATQVSDTERARIVETIVPLIFALPLRDYPAELRATCSGPRLMLTLKHPAPPGTRPECAEDSPESDAVPEKEKTSKRKARPKDIEDIVGYLPAALTPAFADYLKRVLRWNDDKHFCVVTISSGGRRRRVRVTLLARGRGIKIRFLERVHSPHDE